jgi:transcriptional regulator with XRE-family HTH domain
VGRTSQEIGSWLAVERTRRGWSQRAVWKRTGVPPTVLSRLDRGVRDPRLSVIERYAACVGYRLQFELTPSSAADGEQSAVLSDEPATNQLPLG